MEKSHHIPEGQKLIFCRYIRKNGRIIYPKNSKFFCFSLPLNKK